MPYADPEKRKASDKARYWANREQRAIDNKKWRTKNPDRVCANNKRAYEENKEARKAYQAQRYDKKKSYCLAWQKKYRIRNSKAVKESTKNWRERNRHKINAWHYAAYHSDLGFRMRRVLGGRLYKAVKSRKLGRTLELLGCSVEFLIKYLEKQFQPGMTWENYGKWGWHVDHKRPCASFDLADPAQQRECFHYSNLQPLWALDNLRKGDRFTEQAEVGR